MAAPYAAPPQPPRQRRRGGVVVPLILIFLGAVFLLQNTGYLPPTFWLNLWRLWPLVLVLLGIELLLAHRIPWPALAGIAAVVLVLGAVSINTTLPRFGAAAGPPPPTSTSSKTTSESFLQGARQAAVTVRFGAGQLNVGPLLSGPDDQLASMNYEGPPQLVPETHYSVSSGGVGQLDYQTTGRGGPGFIPFTDSRSGTPQMEVLLSPKVPIASLNVQTGATQTHLDLSNLQISSLDMAIGAANASVQFPNPSGQMTAHISGGASTLTIDIPDGVAAQIQHHGGLNTLNVDQNKFPQVSDGIFRTRDYDTAQNKLDLSIDTGITTIQIT